MMKQGSKKRKAGRRRINVWLPSQDQVKTTSSSSTSMKMFLGTWDVRWAYLENNSGPRPQSNVRGTTTEQQQIVEGEEYFIFSENTR